MKVELLNLIIETSISEVSMFWNVFLRGRIVDSVFFDKDCDANYVKHSLINHDGYNPSIIVRKSR